MTRLFKQIAFLFFITLSNSSIAENILVNGDFSNALSGWNAFAINGPLAVSVRNSSVCAPFHTSPAVAFDVFFNRRSAIEQTVVIPSGVTATLKMKTWGQVQPTTAFIYVVDQLNNSTLIDQFIASQLVGSGPSYNCTGNTFETKSYDLSALAGQTVKIRIEATSSGVDGTFAFFDDIELLTSSNGGGSGGSGNIKRMSAVRIICNRSGDLLSATCGATVGDAGAPPRKTPTGIVRFSGKPGSPAYESSCQLQPTSFSPGVSSCTVPYTPPPGFPIGAPFPIDALYEGDSNFQPSATDHKLLMATCVGDASNPCIGGVGLDFGNESIGIIKNALSLLISCGKIGSNAVGNSQAVGGSSCEVNTELEFDLVEELSQFDAEEWQSMAESISDKDARADAVLKAIKDIGSLPRGDLEIQVQNTLDIAKKIQKANQQYYINQLKKKAKAVAGSSLKIMKARIYKAVIPLSTKEQTVKNGKEKLVSLKLNSRSRKIIDILKRSGQDSISATLKAKIKRSNQKKVKKLAIKQSVGIY